MAGALLTGSGNVTVGQVGSGASLTGVKPANAGTSDRLIAVTFTRTGTAPHIAPDGWTLLPTPTDATAGVISVYTAVNPSSYVWTGGSGRQLVIIAKAQDVAASPFGGAGTYATAIQVGTVDARNVLPAVTLDESYELLLAVVTNNSTGGVPVGFGTPDGMSLVGTTATNTGASDSTMAVYQQLVPTAGSSGTRTATHSGTNTGSGAGYLVSLLTVNKPVATGLVVDAGTNRTGVAAGSSQSFTSTASGGTGPYTFSAAQIDGPAVTLNGSGATRSFLAPSTQNGATLTWRVSGSDSLGAIATDTVTFELLSDPNFGAGVQLPPIGTLPVVASRSAPRDLAQMDTDVARLKALAAAVKSYVDSVVGT